MKPKKAMVERIATITPIATRNTPFTISLMMPQRMPNTPKAVRIINRISPTDVLRHLSEICRCRHIFAVFDFFVFNADSRAEGVEFQTILSASRLSDIFLCVFLSHRSFSFRVLEKVGIRECKVFRSKYYPQGWRFLPKTGGLTLLSRPIPELPLRPERK